MACPLPDGPPRIALVRTALWDTADADARALGGKLRHGLRGGRRHGRERRAADRIQRSGEDARTILATEAASTFASLVTRCPDRTSVPLNDLVAEGEALSAPAYAAPLRRQAELRDGFDATLGPSDMVLTPPASGAAPPGLDVTGDAAFCVPWTCLGLQAITLPAGWSEGGLPLGL